MNEVSVVLFRASGKYYTEETWRVPADAIGPYDMDRSPDFRRIDDGAVLVEAQEPWGFPHLFPSLEGAAQMAAVWDEGYVAGSADERHEEPSRPNPYTDSVPVTRADPPRQARMMVEIADVIRRVERLERWREHEVSEGRGWDGS